MAIPSVDSRAIASIIQPGDDNAQTSSLCQLPKEMQHEIWKWIHSPWERAKLSETCRHFYHAMQDPALCKVFARAHLPSDSRPLKRGLESQDYVARCHLKQRIIRGEYTEHTLCKMPTRLIVELPEGILACVESGNTPRIMFLDTQGTVLHSAALDCIDINCIAVFPDKTTAIAHTQEHISVYDLTTDKQWHIAMRHQVIHMAALPGKRLACCLSNGSIHILDAESGTRLRVLKGHTAPVQIITLLPDGRFVSGSNDMTIRVWDPESSAPLLTLEGHTRTVMSLDMLPDRTAFVSRSYDETLKVWDSTSGTLLLTLEGHTHGITDTAVLPSGKFVSASHDETIKVWDPKSGKLLLTLEEPTGIIISLAALPNGMLISSNSHGEIKIWEPSRGTLLQATRKRTSYLLSFMNVLSDGRILFSGPHNTVRCLNFGV